MKNNILFITNIFVSFYLLVLSWFFISLTILDAGGENIKQIGDFVELTFREIGMNFAIKNYLLLLGSLTLVHTGLFVVGCVASWIAYAFKNDRIAWAAAIVYLIGTLCSPICFVFGVVATVLAFLSADKQRKLNQTIKK